MGIPVEVLEAGLLQLPKVECIRVLDRVVASLDADAGAMPPGTPWRLSEIGKPRKILRSS